MARPSPALPLLLACLACCFPEVTKAATYGGASRARETDEDLHVIDVFDMAKEMQRLDYSRHDPHGIFGANGSDRSDDPSHTHAAGQKKMHQKFSPDEIALGLHNSDYNEEDAHDRQRLHRTVPLLVKINRILRDNASSSQNRVQIQSRTAGGTASGTTGRTANGTANGTASGTANGTANGTASGTANGTANGTASGTATSQNFPAFRRSGLFLFDTTEAPWFAFERPTDTTEDYQFQARAVTPTDTPTDPPTDTPTDPPTDTPTDPPTDTPTDPSTDTPTDTSAATTTETATTTITDTLLITDTTTETATETTTTTEVTTSTRTISVTTTYTEVETLTSTVVETITTSVTASTTTTLEAAAAATRMPSADQNKGPEITPVQPVSPSGWLYGSLAFAGLGLMLMVAGGVWLIITFVRKASMNARRGIV